MPKMPLPPFCQINYTIDDYAWLWESPDSILCVHGVAEGTRAWVRWRALPGFGYRRVVRMDQRGYGDSTPMAADFAWNLNQLADDEVRLVERVAPEGLHRIGAKISGPVVTRAATCCPDLIKTLILVGTPIKGPEEHEWLAMVERDGVRFWAEQTMEARLEGMSDAAKALMQVDIDGGTRRNRP